MSEFSFPFTGGAGGDDGPYSASFFAGILEGVFRQEDRADASVLFGTGSGTGLELLVTETSPNSANVELKSGKALLQGYYYLNNADLTIPIPANTDGSGFDRIDTIVLEIDFINNVVRAKNIEGTPAGVPVAPTLTKTASVYQVPLANIEVANLFSTISNADIDNTVREQGILWTTKQGGTNIEGGYVAYDLIGATGTDVLDIITGGGEFHIPVGDSGESGNYGLIDRRQIVIWRDAIAAQTLTTSTIIELTDSNDPTGYLLQLSANQFRLALGTYRIVQCGLYLFNNGTSASFVYALRNNDTSTILATSSDTNINESIANATQYIPMANLEFTVTDITHDYELIVGAGAASTRVQSSGGVYGGTYPAIEWSVLLILERIQ